MDREHFGVCGIRTIRVNGGGAAGDKRREKGAGGSVVRRGHGARESTQAGGARGGVGARSAAGRDAGGSTGLERGGPISSRNIITWRPGTGFEILKL
jgi:hypothetical protein